MVRLQKNLYPSLWAGIECSINRVNNSFFDQLDYSGHYLRDNDIHEICNLGISAVRYPVLWENHEREFEKPIDWNLTAKRLKLLRERNVEPIVGLLHHGSGPAFTQLENNNFPELFATYAKRVAQQFPCLNYFTPINEPLTTARFSGLYGHWFPHKRSNQSFCRIFINQMKAIVLAMEAIRGLIPSAILVQTEDIGETFSTPALQYQANFENQRRWLTYDILLGRLNNNHPLWTYFIESGILEKELYFFLENICQVDIVGLNHYVTSERFIDENLADYPVESHGGNGRQKYADVEAIRVKHSSKYGIGNLLKQCADKFKLPIAITEVHMNCHREHQLRWLNEVWNECVAFNKTGGNVTAVTAWAALGSFGWNKLLTEPKGNYECGVFDLRAEKPRKTIMAKCIHALATNNTYQHPILKAEGWWQSNMRFIREASREPNKKTDCKDAILIIGKTGTLGKAFAKICTERNISHYALSKSEVNITEVNDVEKAINFYKPWAIINTAGFVKIDEADEKKEQCFKVNTLGVINLAQLCKKHGVKLMTFSTDQVFDGSKGKPYLESDKTNPLNLYGYSKMKSEEEVIYTLPTALIIRSSAFFGPWDKYNFAYNLQQSLLKDDRIKVMSDVWISPTYIPDLVHVALDLLIDDENKIWHLTNQAEVTWADFAKEICLMAGFSGDRIIGESINKFTHKAIRPYYSVLSSEKAKLLPSLEHALNRYFTELNIE